MPQTNRPPTTTTGEGSSLKARACGLVAALPTLQPIEPDEVARLVARLSSTDNVSIAGVIV